MIYAAVLAGGSGSRMGATEKPKQFLEIGGKPVIVHTVRQFLIHERIDHVIICCPKEWVKYTEGLMKEHFGDTHISVIAGGKERNDTLMNAVKHIEKRGDLENETIIVTHDAVRPFVTQRIITENIETTEKYGSCNTAVPATDTILVSSDGEVVDSIPERSTLFQTQTPQSFRAVRLRELFEALTDKEKSVLTDAVGIYTARGEKVHIVQGEMTNIKLTYPNDLITAETILSNNIGKYTD